MDRNNTRLMPDAQDMSTPGAAVAGMMLNSLGCAQWPVSLPPQWGARTPRTQLLREGIAAEIFNRLKLGRTLEWDAAKGQIKGDEEANRLLRRPYRAPWVHPGAG